MQSMTVTCTLADVSSDRPNEEQLKIAHNGSETNVLANFIAEKVQCPSALSRDPLFEEIVAELTSYPLDYLHTIPYQLKTTQKKLKEEVEKLAATHYPVFLAKAEASHVALENFSSILSANERLLTGITSLTQRSHDLVPKLHQIMINSRNNAKALEKQTQLLELLELPQLCDTCIRNGYYDDAISILGYTKRLVDKHGADLPIVNLIGHQVRHSGLQLVHQLCDQLRSPVTLPSCIKAVVYLRRTETFSEEELRLKFLQTRGRCLRNALQAVLNARSLDKKSISSESGGFVAATDKQQSEAYLMATRRIEVTRTQLFDIVTQYRAIFTEEERYPTSRLREQDSRLSLAGLNTMNANPLCLSDWSRTAFTDLGSRTEVRLCHAWLTRQINDFLKQFSNDLTRMLHLTKSGVKNNLPQPASGTSKGWDLPVLFGHLQSLVAQAMHFGRSFSRLGCDFSPQLADLCSNAFLSYFHDYTVNAVSDFAAALNSMPWQIGTADTIAGDQTHSDQTIDGSTDIEPPRLLLHHPPLILFCNQLLELFNGMRICCPANLTNRLTILFANTLHEASVKLVQAYRTRVEQELVNWRTKAVSTAKAFTTSLVPHLLVCLTDCLFRMPSGESSTGSATSESTIHSGPLVHRLTRLVCSPVYAAWPHLAHQPSTSFVTTTTLSSNIKSDICSDAKLELDPMSQEVEMGLKVVNVSDGD